MPGKYDFTIVQGETFSKVLTWKDSSKDPVDLSDYSASMVIKENLDASTDIATTEGVSPTIIITLGGALGTITIAMTDTVTGAMSFDRAIYVLELTDGSDNVKRLLEGEVYLSRK